MSHRGNESATQHVTLRVRRGDSTRAPYYSSWRVPFQQGMSVLDALLWVRLHRDPTLAVRFSCLNAHACKTCTALIDGRPGYLCATRLTGADVTCEPLPTRPWLRDLVVDLTRPDERLPGP